MIIGFNNLTDYSIDQSFLEKVARKVLAEEQKSSLANKRKKELSIVFLNEEKIAALNKAYRARKHPTDVLSFDYQDSGEIVICPGQVKKNADTFNACFKRELTKTLIHGILHLMGYDHELGKKQACLMEKKQNYYLDLWQKTKL